MNLLPNDELLLDAVNCAEAYVSKLHILTDQIGRLDDVYETPYIDNRLETGAYQCLTHAITKLELYIDELNHHRGVK